MVSVVDILRMHDVQRRAERTMRFWAIKDGESYLDEGFLIPTRIRRDACKFSRKRAFIYLRHGICSFMQAAENPRVVRITIRPKLKTTEQLEAMARRKAGAHV